MIEQRNNDSGAYDFETPKVSQQGLVPPMMRPDFDM